MYSLGEYYIVIPKILKVWPSYIAGKRSFVAFPIYQMSGPTLFLVAQVYLIFYQYISRIYLNCTCCVRWGGVTPPHTPPVATSLSTINLKPRLVNYQSHIKHNNRTCGIVYHFPECHGADHSLLKNILIDQRHGSLRECEKFWIGMLLTNQRGFNSTHDFAQK